MAGRYKPYSEYKDSGIEWLGVIPNTWSIARMDDLAATIKDQIAPKELESKVVIHYSIPTVQEIGIGRAEEGDTIDSNKFIVTDGDVLFSKLNPRKQTISIVASHEHMAVASTEFVVLRLTTRDQRYLQYLLYSQELSSFVCSQVESATKSHQRINPSVISKLKFALPSENERSRISNFLDHETAKIDTLIEKQKQFIQLLKEKRQAVISHAVTKGLNPSTKMRESGILSVGTIPEHWTLKSLSLASKKLAVGLAMSVTDCYEEEGIPIIRNQNIKEGYFDGSDMLYLNPVFAKAQASKKVKAGDVVIVRTGSNVGLACCVPDEYDQCHTFTTLIVTPSDELVKEYFTYCMNSAYGKAEVNRLKFGFGKDNLNVGELRAMHALLPSVNEQKEIVSYLEQEVAKIELMVKKAHIAIELMQERRTALISAAVTGKIDVRDWVAPQTSQTNKEVAA